MMATISGVRPDTPFQDKLQKDECQSQSEFYRFANKIMHLETAREAIQTGKSTPSEKSNDNGKMDIVSVKKTNKKAKTHD